jgi:hypothetical protein
MSIVVDSKEKIKQICSVQNNNESIDEKIIGKNILEGKDQNYENF